MSSTEKDRVWRNSKFYSVGYIAYYVSDWKVKLGKIQEKYLSEERLGMKKHPEILKENIGETVKQRTGDLHKATGEIAFPWNRKYEYENETQKKLESEFKINEMSESGAYI